MLKDFQRESKIVIRNMLEILDRCEGHFELVKQLEDYGQLVDRIMGGAKSLATICGDPHGSLMPIGDYTAILKAVGYRSAQIQQDEKLFGLSVAVLQDATECLADLIERMFDPVVKVKDVIPRTLIDRVKWISSQFTDLSKHDRVAAKLGAQKMNQNEIDQLIKKLGL